ncbi:MAG: DUF3238 domain-containing protein [Kiritimatiellae bacterium]|nr:DUF3238 domain-containing protein [Kiritimatiellia bacterium]
MNVGGFVIQVADTGYTNAYVFPPNTWIDPGRFLLLGGSLVTNRDLEVDFTMPNRFANDATAAVRLAAEVGTNPNTWATDGDIFPWPPLSGAVSDWWGSDSYEIANGWNPLVFDENANGIPDSWEMAFPSTNLYADADGDGISNDDELAQNSDPNDINSTTAQPYVIRYESSMPGWEKDGMTDIGLEGWVKTYFEGLKADMDLCVWVKEGRTQEEFRVVWRGATEKGIHWLSEQEVVTSASAGADTRPYLFVQDLGMHPDYTNTLGGEYKMAVLKAEFPIEVTAFIPHDHISDPFHSIMGIVFGGDDRGFDKNATSYRMRQKVAVVTIEECDADGLKEGSIANLVGTTRSYDEATSVDSGTGKLTAAAKADTVTGAPLMIDYGTASTSGMNITVNRLTNRKVEAVIVGSAANPLVPFAPAIDYDFTVTIDSTDPLNSTYQITGSHDGFPAYEVYISNQRIHEHDPIATGEGPLSLGPPKEHNVNHSGDIQ